MICDAVDEYIDIVHKAPFPVCEDQILLIDNIVIPAFETEDIHFDESQFLRYMKFEKYFDFKLFPWEKFCFGLHNCTYRSDGLLRWPELLILIGRGGGKNGYLSFEDFSLLTPVNGIKEYHIDIFATAEDQAKQSFLDVYNMLEDNEAIMKDKFHWTKEVIENYKTRSMLKFRTSNFKTKDGGRPGKVDFDEYHQYETYKLIQVAKTGLGKKRLPRQTIISTNGDVRDGPLDHLIARSEGILKGDMPDNGMLPFICRLDDKAEVDDERNWHKANPSLRYLPTLMDQMRREYIDYKMDAIGNASFMTKRMNIPAGNKEAEVTSWENILACEEEPLPDMTGWTCVACLDFAKSNDFVAVGLLFERDQEFFFLTHTWVCRSNKEMMSRVRFPLQDAADKGLLTFVDEVEISPELPCAWIASMAEVYSIEGVAVDTFRYALVKSALKDIGFTPEAKNLFLVKLADTMRIAPVITSKFNKHMIHWEKNPLMRWYVNNTKVSLDSKGNISFEKIEPKARKTDGFMCMVAGATVIDKYEGWNDSGYDDLPPLIIF